jgi:hypothetical protein
MQKPLLSIEIGPHPDRPLKYSKVPENTGKDREASVQAPKLRKRFNASLVGFGLLEQKKDIGGETMQTQEIASSSDKCGTRKPEEGE